MDITAAAYRLRVLFDGKVTGYYYNTFKGEFGRVQADAMNHLYECGEARGQDIADWLDISKQHASKIMAKLEDMGLAVRREDPEDRRSYLYRLTEAGRALIRVHIEESDRNFERLFAGLTEEERTRAAEAMETLVGLLKKL